MAVSGDRQGAAPDVDLALVAVIAVGDQGPREAAGDDGHRHVAAIGQDASLAKVARHSPFGGIRPEVVIAAHPSGRGQLVDGAAAVAVQCEGVVGIGRTHGDRVERQQFIAHTNMAVVKLGCGCGDGFAADQRAAVGDGGQVRFAQDEAGVAIVGFAHHGRRQADLFGGDHAVAARNLVTADQEVVACIGTRQGQLADAVRQMGAGVERVVFTHTAHTDHIAELAVRYLTRQIQRNVVHGRCAIVGFADARRQVDAHTFGIDLVRADHGDGVAEVGTVFGGRAIDAQLVGACF